MAENSEQRLKELLTNVSDSYDDFVNGELLFAKKHNYVDKIIDFIENTPNVTTSQVIEKGAELSGIKPVYTGE
ncbi:MAG: hypothetical protein J1F60_06590 [Oscillospiraceae bacterium]|nr:hypothetical protein [Oscillospiraceae bacterium]